MGILSLLRIALPVGRRSVRELCSYAVSIGKFAPLLFLSAFFFVSPANAQRTQVKPGWNKFSTADDISLGKRAATDAEKQLPLCNDPKVDAYLTRIGLRLAQKAPTGGAQYPFEFHCVNDKAINAFALPGGYVFINRGAIEAADNESQLAGVMAHELSHVALRHGTNQATKALVAETGLGIFGAIFGDSTSGAAVTTLGSFVAGGVLLRYSRTAESEADVVGTQILYDSGFDPRSLAQFFEKLDAETKGKNPPEFFSDHPSPEHRVERVDQEIAKLGGAPPNARRDSAEFESIKREVMALPVVKKPTQGAATGPPPPPAPPSRNFVSYQGYAYSLKHPDNWKVHRTSEGEETAEVNFAPENGFLDDGSGHYALAYGLIVAFSNISSQDSYDEQSLYSGTEQVLTVLQHANPDMKIVRQGERLRLNGLPGLSSYLSNASPAGGQETDWVVTVIRPEGMIYFVCVAPQAAFDNYEKTFSSVLDSVRFVSKH